MDFEVLELMPDAVVVSGADGAILYVNAMAETLFGYDRGELVGRPLEILVPSRFRTTHRRLRHEFDAAPRVRPMGSELSLFGLRKSGEEFPVDISLAPLLIGFETCAIAAVRDATERKAFEERVRRLERAEEEIRQRQALARIVTHPEGR